MAQNNAKLTTLLNKIATEQGFNNYELIVNEISSGGANYTSKLYTAVIKERPNTDLRLFAKVGIMREQATSKIYKTERFAYTELAKIYDTLQDKHQIMEEDRLVFSKLYGCDASAFKEMIVLEDLAYKGYESYDRFKSMEWEYASSAIRELAKLHAVSFAHAAHYPNEFSRIIKDIKQDRSSEAMEGLLDSMAVTAISAVKAENKERLKKHLVNVQDMFVKFFAPLRRSVIIHYDYRPSNLMHRVGEDGKIEIKIVDLQTLQGGSPVVDLLYFIFTGSDEQFRAAHYDQLIDHYYAQLSQAMRRLALDPDRMYSREDFDYELKEKLPFGLSIAVFTLPVVTVEVENAPQVNEDLDISAFSVQKTSDLYSERLNGVVNDYVKWGILT